MACVLAVLCGVSSCDRSREMRTRPDDVIVLSTRASRAKPAARWAFGEVEAGARAQHAFQVENEGTQVVSLAVRSTSSGCLRVVRTTGIVERGAVGSVVVELNTSGLCGETSQVAYLVARGAGEHVISLAVTADVRRGNDAPAVEVREPGHDLGVIEQGSRHTWRFAIRNVGNGPLALGVARTSCGACISVLSEDRTVPPGGEGVVEVALDSSGKRGRFAQWVFVETNDPCMPVLRLSVSGTARCAWPSQSEVDFGTVGAQEHVQRTIYVFLAGEPTGGIRSVTCEDGSLICRTLPPVAGEGGQLRACGVVLDWGPAGVAAGDFRSSVRIATSVPGFEALTVPVRGYLVGDVVTRPSRIFFGRVRPGQAVSRTCEIESPAAATWDVGDVNFVPGRLDMTVRSDPGEAEGQAGRVTVTLSPPPDSSGGESVRGVLRGYIGGRQVMGIPYFALIDRK